MNRDVKIRITKDEVSVTLDNNISYHSANTEEMVDVLMNELSSEDIEEVINALFVHIVRNNI